MVVFVSWKLISEFVKSGRHPDVNTAFRNVNKIYKGLKKKKYNKWEDKGLNIHSEKSPFKKMDILDHSRLEKKKKKQLLGAGKLISFMKHVGKVQSTPSPLPLDKYFSLILSYRHEPSHNALLCNSFFVSFLLILQTTIVLLEFVIAMKYICLYALPDLWNLLPWISIVCHL